MELALIPPISALKTATLSRVHLVLSHVLQEQAYLDFYKSLNRTDHKLILDNGAHEHDKGEDLMSTLHAAIAVGGVDVIALPDVQQDSSQTFALTRDAIQWLGTQAGYELYAKADFPQLMFVPQGRSEQEWSGCLIDMMEAYDEFGFLLSKQLPLVGIAKKHDLLIEGGLLTLCQALQSRWPMLKGHILGWPSTQSVLQVGKMCSKIVSIDTAKPYVYAHAQINVKNYPPLQMPEIHRPPDYFHARLQEPYMLRNIEAFEQLAKGETYL